MEELLMNDPALSVVCAGGGSFTKQEIELLTLKKISSQVVQKNFQENELGQYYAHAICFVFPTRYEGFGIPVLESMACRCPIVLAKHSSFPEVAGEAGIYFDLNSKKDLQEKVIGLVNDELLRKEYISKGYVQAKKFNWDKAALECLAVYKSVV
jgi:glycosyltransferase involved in cell wall biosynthesis